MKISLHTIHHANSYGGVLQAFAAKRVLQQFGEVEVLDVNPPAIARTLKLIRFSPRPRALLHTVKDLLRLFPRRRLLRKFDTFCRTHLDVGRQTLLAEHGYADLVVAGSDQIWNPAITDGLCPSYYLADQQSKKISFSASLGSYRYSENEKAQALAWLSDFSAISVRESDSAEYLSSLLGRKVYTTLDPTLMLTRESWSQIAVHPKGLPKDFVLIYSLKENRHLRKVVSKAKEMGLPIVAISQNPVCSFAADIHVRDAGPAEFLGLFLAANYVVTNSFHGTAFAINFGRPFVVVPPESGSNRICGLLSALRLEHHYCPEVSPDPIRFSEIGEEALQLLSGMRQQTSSFLEQAVRG